VCKVGKSQVAPGLGKVKRQAHSTSITAGTTQLAEMRREGTLLFPVPSLPTSSSYLGHSCLTG